MVQFSLQMPDVFVCQIKCHLTIGVRPILM